MNVDHDETGETGGQRHAAGTGGERHGVDIQFTATHSENPGDIDRSAGDIIDGSSDGGWMAATNPHSPENGAVMLGGIDSPTSAVSARWSSSADSCSSSEFSHKAKSVSA